MCKRCDELESEHFNLWFDFYNLESEYKETVIVLNQVWGMPIQEPIDEDLRITPKLAEAIIKNMEKIIKNQEEKK